ncbi:similar to Saccharomyces cerevisiae YDL214C PRR2 Serine/threonine protein kinase that inhibits pheromone induced signalling downstream of MAPK [Maudiozyma saulgeensis]|uniref:non-specific serine/threonine protein kinase n=1 Tax=Maudiozyma saulgeensis TaxID=1789683 RepID=A0A1X7R6M5_9SACH|nr:similar to Saccharomyces cerevisiae YDL214C PRR2 Serine/threonine protein kinase that inhibits pheromone induced signalling downstream of MAPK [Kazachstania saulgeensis]
MSASIDIPTSEAPPSYNHVFGNIQYRYGDGSPIHYFERALGEDAESEISLESSSPHAVGPDIQRYTTTVSSSIPFQLPYNDENHDNNTINMNGTSRRGSTNTTGQASVCSTWLESMGHSFPDNMTRIESNEIVSPLVASVESRFQIPLTKLHDSHRKQLATKARRSYSMSSSSGNHHNSRTFKNLLFHRRESHATILEGKQYDGEEHDEEATPNNNKLSFDEKYVYTGNVLGEGSGGSVKVVKRRKDNAMFAVKAFHPYEDTLTKGHEEEESYTVQSYLKKIKAEYCISSILKHPNIISTIEIIEQDEHTLLQVMEYVQYDLFAIVMSEQLHYSEACCYFWQLLQGVQYLHNIGLAHRDLKLDNLVVDKHGQLKIIDFGAAVVYKSPYTDHSVENNNEITMAKGIVGSDPYLPPELYIFETYDPRAIDIWAIGIIFICMILRSFPWRYPRLKDLGFRRFCLCRRGANTLNELVTRDKTIPEDDMIIQYEDETTRIMETDENDNDDNHIIGPMRLLAPLPEETQHVLLRILDPSPIRRPSIEMILSDDWVRSIDYCQDNLHHGKDHEHTRLDPTKAHIANLRPSSD